MRKRIIFGVLALVILSAVALAGCQPATVVVPAPQVTIQMPAATTPSGPSGLMGDTVQQLIQLQMYKSILTDTSTNNNNGGWHGGHGHGGH